MAEAVCIASGPSLTVEDVEMVRGWRASASDRFVVVANTSFRIAPWADFQFAMDDKWWRVYRDEFKRSFKGLGYCQNGSAAIGYAVTLSKTKGFETFGNSGSACVMLAHYKGARRIVMLGYDCNRTGGKSHWHGDHPRGLGNAGSLHKWPIMFDRLAAAVKDAEVINASRETRLKCFQRLPLAQALGTAA